MRVKLFVKNEDLDAFNSFYEDVNKGKIKDKKDIPLLDIKTHVKSQVRHKYVEVLLLYDVYKGMQFIYEEKLEELKKSKSK